MRIKRKVKEQTCKPKDFFGLRGYEFMPLTRSLGGWYRQTNTRPNRGRTYNIEMDEQRKKWTQRNINDSQKDAAN